MTYILLRTKKGKPFFRTNQTIETFTEYIDFYNVDSRICLLGQKYLTEEVSRELFSIGNIFHKFYQKVTFHQNKWTLGAINWV